MPEFFSGRAPEFYTDQPSVLPEEVQPISPTNVNAPRVGKDKSLETQKKDAKNKTLLRYPLTIFHEKTDYLRINIVSYKPIDRDLRSTPTNRQIPTVKGNGKIYINSIILPIPSNIQDNNSTSYTDSNINSIVAEGLKGIQNVMGAGNNNPFESTEKFTEAGKNAIQAFMSGIDDTVRVAGGAEGIGSLLSKYFASQAIGVFGGNVSVDQILARQQGVIFNPNMEMLFNNPTIRGFNFSFKFTPRNEKEATEVKNIIRTFKQNMAPQVTTTGTGGSNTFLKTPNVFELSYKKGPGDHPYLNRFKQCFLENMSVNYTGEGTYATYEKGEPISMIMNLQFKELQPIYDIDYNDVGGVGY